MDEILNESLKEQDDLDPDEFDLPDVELPTLESILKQTDDKESDDEEFPAMPLSLSPGTDSSASYTGKNLDVLKSLETMSITSSDSKFCRKSDVIHGSVLAFGEMSMISNSLRMSYNRIDSGRPTAIAIANLIAVGTGHGLVLLYDSQQSLKFVLGSSAVGDKYGAVTSLDFNSDSSRLLAGYAKGQILMYDLSNGKLLRTITDAHPPGVAVLHVKFTDDLTLAVCNDSGGSVFELNFRRVMGIRSCESRCLFSGSRGEVCVISPLHFSKQIVDHPLRDRHLLAMGTVTKVLVVTLRPQIKVVFTHILKNVKGTVPLLSWQLRVFNQFDARTIDPVLMFARSDVVYFVRAKLAIRDNIIFEHLLTMNLTYQLINTVWLNSKTVLLLDEFETVRAADVDTQCELQSVSLENVQLVYNSATFKSIATGGNVSKALAEMGEHACYHSMVAWSGMAVILGVDTVHVARVRQWNERIDTALKTLNGHRTALNIALSYYEGTAKAVLGLPSSNEERKQIVSSKILDMLVEYVDLSMTKLAPDSGKLEVLIQFFRDVVPVCVEYCIAINRVDVLCSRIYDRFRVDSIAHGVFLECLEPYILDGKLAVLSPALVNDFVCHYEAKNLLSSIESCLLHLSLENLDIQQVLNTCWCHGLYDVIFHIHNRAMSDYITPMLELLHVLENAINSSTGSINENMVSLGNKLLVYISCCLAGAAYPSGVINPEQSNNVKIQTYDCLMCDSRYVWSYQFATTYPVLTILLKFSTRECLNVLSLAFTEDLFQGDEGSLRSQQMVDVLLKVMVENPGFTPNEVGSLFIFLARQICRQSLRVNHLVLSQIVEYLTSTDTENDARYEEKQQAIVELINADIIGNREDEYRLITLVERAGFYQALRLLYQRNQRYDLIFETYLKDKSQQTQCFSYVYSVLQNDTDDYTPMHKDQMKKMVVVNVKALISINGQETAKLITTAMRGSLKDVTSSLKNEPRVLYSFLRGLFDSTTKENESGSITESVESDQVELTNPYFMDSEVVELYLSLMCQCDRGRVLSFVKTLEIYKPKNTLEIVRRYHVDEATAFLVEENGDFSAAFAILHKLSKEKLRDILITRHDPLVAHDNKNIDATVNESKLIFADVIMLCQRSSGKLTEEPREKLWFNLLDTAIDPWKIIKDLPNEDEVLVKAISRGLSQYVLNSMMGHIALPAVMQKVIHDPSFDSGNFGEIKQLLLGMLETYQYEKTLLNTTLNLLAHDRHQSLAGLHRAVVRGMAPRSQLCSICKKTILNRFQTNTNKNNVVVFNSGAVYHESCLKRDESIPQLMQPISPFSPHQPKVVNQEVDFSSPSTHESRVSKERQTYIERQKHASNGIKIFPKQRKVSPQTENKVFRREGSLFAVPIQASNSQEGTSSVDLSKQKRSVSLRTLDFDHKSFKLHLATPVTI